MFGQQGRALLYKTLLSTPPSLGSSNLRFQYMKWLGAIPHYPGPSLSCTHPDQLPWGMGIRFLKSSGVYYYIFGVEENFEVSRSKNFSSLELMLLENSHHFSWICTRWWVQCSYKSNVRCGCIHVVMYALAVPVAPGNYLDFSLWYNTINVPPR